METNVNFKVATFFPLILCSQNIIFIGYILNGTGIVVKLLFKTFFLLLMLSPLLAKNADQRKELEELRQQIANYENQIAQKKAKEETVAHFIGDLDKGIDLTANYLRNLKNDIYRSEGLIAVYQKNINEISFELEKLKTLIKKRIVTFYKKRKSKEIELLLSIDSPGKIKSWLKYQKLVAEHDKRTYNSMIQKKQNLEKQQELLTLQINSKRKNIDSKNREERQLVASRKKRSSLLTTLHNDAELLQRRLDEIKAAQRQIHSFITKSEERRLTADARPQTSSDFLKPKRPQKFSQLMGQLTWPAKGEIISHFGQHKHPILKTVTNNLGIEIRADLRSPIYAVDVGIVQTITWQRGRGNIIILSHDDGFYTVYTHLAEIHVDVQDFVETGQVIGTVGDSGSLNGPVLHFQIWKNTENLDPEKWLKKPLLTFNN